MKSPVLTLRQYFAGQVIQGLSAELLKENDEGFEIHYDFHAQTAVQMADALIEELSKCPKD